MTEESRRIILEIKCRYLERRLAEMTRKYLEKCEYAEILEVLTLAGEQARINEAAKYDADDQPRDELGQFAEKDAGKSKDFSQLAAMMGFESVKLEMPEGLTGGESDDEIYKKLDPNTVAAYNNAAVGKAAPNGVNVTEIEPHAFAQATRRGVSLSDFEGIFDDPGAEIRPVTVLNNGRRTQKIYGTRAGIFIDIDSGVITSVVN